MINKFYIQVPDIPSIHTYTSYISVWLIVKKRLLCCIKRTYINILYEILKNCELNAENIVVYFIQNTLSVITVQVCTSLNKHYAFAERSIAHFIFIGHYILTSQFACINALIIGISFQHTVKRHCSVFIGWFQEALTNTADILRCLYHSLLSLHHSYSNKHSSESKSRYVLESSAGY